MRAFSTVGQHVTARCMLNAAFQYILFLCTPRTTSRELPRSTTPVYCTAQTIDISYILGQNRNEQRKQHVHKQEIDSIYENKIYKHQHIHRTAAKTIRDIVPINPPGPCRDDKLPSLALLAMMTMTAVNHPAGLETRIPPAVRDLPRNFGVARGRLRIHLRVRRVVVGMMMHRPIRTRRVHHVRSRIRLRRVRRRIHGVERRWRIRWGRLAVLSNVSRGRHRLRSRHRRVEELRHVDGGLASLRHVCRGVLAEKGRVRRDIGDRRGSAGLGDGGRHHRARLRAAIVELL